MKAKYSFGRQKESKVESVSGWWYVASLVAAGAIVAGGLYMLRRWTPSAHERGSSMDDLNRLLQEGSVTPDEYELLKRRLLAGHVA